MDVAWRAAVVVLVGLLAGCAASAPKAPAESTGSVTLLPPTGPVKAIACPVDCYEPAIAIDAAARIVVVTAHEGTLAVSEDDGLTYAEVGAPPLPPGSPPQVTQWDGTVAAGPDGRLFYYAFLAIPTGAILPSPPLGLQVAVSSDGAHSWSSNLFLSVLQGPAQPVVSPWKSWLGFAPDGTLYLDYNSRGSGLWLARSDDGGKSWVGFTRVNPPDDRLISVFMGPPVVDSQGRLYVPYFGDQSPGLGNPFLPEGHALRVATSDDKGATFQQHVLATKPLPDYVGAFFPILAVDREDRLALAHWDPAGHMQVWASFDRGSAWQGPIQWSGEESTVAAPWLTVDDGRVSLLYYGGNGMGYARGSIAGGTLSGPAEHGALVDSVDGGGDFIHFALDAHGRMVVPVPDRSTKTLSVIVGPPLR